MPLPSRSRTPPSSGSMSEDRANEINAASREIAGKINAEAREFTGVSAESQRHGEEPSAARGGQAQPGAGRLGEGGHRDAGPCVRAQPGRAPVRAGKTGAAAGQLFRSPAGTWPAGWGWSLTSRNRKTVLTQENTNCAIPRPSRRPGRKIIGIAAQGVTHQGQVLRKAVVVIEGEELGQAPPDASKPKAKAKAKKEA